MRRPCESRDPSPPSFVGAEAVSHRAKTRGRGVWVPAFAGTTLRYHLLLDRGSVDHALAEALRKLPKIGRRAPAVQDAVPDRFAFMPRPGLSMFIWHSAGRALKRKSAISSLHSCPGFHRDKTSFLCALADRRLHADRRRECCGDAGSAAGRFFPHAGDDL